MNKQLKVDKFAKIVGLGIEWTHYFGSGSGYTVNPVRGCLHDCEWEMKTPDGSTVKVGCYAKAQRERLDGPGSFEKITFHPEVFNSIRAQEKRCGIFIDSMSDLFGQSVTDDWIDQVIKVMRECHQHVFFTLTKNPRRLKDFNFPSNCLVGLSSPPTFMYGKKLTPAQQQRWFEKGCQWLADSSSAHKWLSLEPLSIDVSATIRDFQPYLCWAVPGAGSDGARKFQPDETIFRQTIEALGDLPVFLKGNVDRTLAERVCGSWRQEFPKLNLLYDRLAASQVHH